MATHSSILACKKFHVQRSMEGYSPRGRKEQTRPSVHALVTCRTCLLSEMQVLVTSHAFNLVPLDYILFLLWYSEYKF